MSAIGPLQIAIVARLKADAAVAAIVGVKVFDGVAPGGTDLPFVTVDSLTGVEEGGALGNVAFGHTAGVHAFASDAEGNKAVLTLAAAVKAALRAPLALTGHSSTRLRLEFETVTSEPGDIRHAPMRFRTFAMETA